MARTTSMPCLDCQRRPGRALGNRYGVNSLLRTDVAKTQGAHRIYHVMMYIAFCAMYLFVLRQVAAPENPRLFQWTFPLPPVVLGFFFCGRSDRGRFLCGIAGGVCAYLVVFLFVELSWPVVLVPRIASIERLSLLVCTVFLGALHGTVISLALYGAYRMVGLCRRWTLRRS